MHERVLALVLGACWLMPSAAGADVPMTPWGRPSLEGVWTTATLTPLERPDALGDTPLSEAQRAELEAEAEKFWAALEQPPPPGQVGGYNREWLDPGMKALPDGRPSLVVDPPDGRIPWRPEARAASEAEVARYGVGPYYSYADLDTGERCLSDGVTMAPLQPYNMNYQILQTEDHLAIVHEMYHEYRIVPLDGRPFLPEEVGQWLGDARGHWEGDTLVIVSKGFADKSHYYWAWPWRAARPSLTVVERLRRVDEETIDYEFTVEDPEMFTRPWTASAPMTTDQASRGVTAGPLYEFACHEGNYALPNILRGARLEAGLARAPD